jgi:hypothetical protein
MKFQNRFVRRKGGTGPVPLLGSDVDPTTYGIDSAGIESSKAAALNDVNSNVLCARNYSNLGWPVHRVAVGYKPPSGTVNLVANAYVLDRGTFIWFQIGPVDVPLIPNKITFFDMVSPVEQGSQVGFDTMQGQSFDFFLRVTDPGGAPDGEHIFVMLPDLTTIGY